MQICRLIQSHNFGSACNHQTYYKLFHTKFSFLSSVFQIKCELGLFSLLNLCAFFFLFEIKSFSRRLVKEKKTVLFLFVHLIMFCTTKVEIIPSYFRAEKTNMCGSGYSTSLFLTPKGPYPKLFFSKF